MRSLLLLAVVLFGCVQIPEPMPEAPKPTLQEKQAAAKSLIRDWEKLRLRAYKCSAQRWSIGFGTISKAGEKITEAEAEKRMVNYLEQNVYSKGMARYADELSIGQYAAFASYQYNTGKRITSCDTILTRWEGFTAKGKFTAGLENRRVAEYAVCAEVSIGEAWVRNAELTKIDRNGIIRQKR